MGIEPPTFRLLDDSLFGVTEAVKGALMGVILCISYGCFNRLKVEPHHNILGVAPFADDKMENASLLCPVDMLVSTAQWSI